LISHPAAFYRASAANTNQVRTGRTGEICHICYLPDGVVVAQLLEGHSSESISNSPGISADTLRIHRRKVYAKPGISSQQELLAIFFQ